MAVAALIPVIGGLVSSAGNLFSAIQNRKTQELINEGQYVGFISEKELQRQEQETYLMLAGLVLIIVLSVLIFKSR